MDNSFAFNSHRFIKRLTDIGMNKSTAEVLADEKAKFLNENVATKQQLAQTEANVLTKIAESETRLLKWMIGLIIALFVALITLN